MDSSDVYLHSEEREVVTLEGGRERIGSPPTPTSYGDGPTLGIQAPPEEILLF